MRTHLEISEAEVADVADKVYVFWKNLNYLLHDVGCPHATYSFLKRDVTLDQAVSTIAWQRGWGDLPAERYDKVSAVVLERVRARLDDDVTRVAPPPTVDPRPRARHGGAEWFYGGPDNDACTRHRLYRDDGTEKFVFNGDFEFVPDGGEE